MEAKFIQLFEALDFENATVTTVEGERLAMVKLFLRVRVQGGQEHLQEKVLDPVWMQPTAALAFAEALRAHALRSASLALQDEVPPVGSQAH